MAGAAKVGLAAVIATGTIVAGSAIQSHDRSNKAEALQLSRPKDGSGAGAQNTTSEDHRESRLLSEDNGGRPASREHQSVGSDRRGSSGVDGGGGNPGPGGSSDDERSGNSGPGSGDGSENHSGSGSSGDGGMSGSGEGSSGSGSSGEGSSGDGSNGEGSGGTGSGHEGSGGDGGSGSEDSGALLDPQHSDSGSR
jgi:hypothetical protein